MRKTNQKDAILSAVNTMKNHPTADQIYSSLKPRITKLSLGTVYRNLQKFSQDGKIRKVAVPGESDRFDYRLEQHDHFLCTECDTLSDTDVHLDLTLKKMGDMQINGYSLILYGICVSCVRKSKPETQ